jgi:putative hydrolase of the HAD superfamily
MSRRVDVKGVFFDYGGVVEDLQSDRTTFQKGVSILSEMLEDAGIRMGAEDLARSLREGQGDYEKWYRKNEYRELPNEEIWSRFFLKKQCGTLGRRKKIESMAEELSSVYEFYLYKRRPPPGMVEVLKTLFQNRFVLSMVSNTMSRTLIPERLQKFGVDRYFGTVVLSMETGMRKPNAAIFERALRQAGLQPAQCLFIGDTVSRDIEGSRRAGFHHSVLIRSSITDEKDRGYDGDGVPDFTLERLEDLLPLLLR